jgi:hypothetical protein
VTGDIFFASDLYERFLALFDHRVVLCGDCQQPDELQILVVRNGLHLSPETQQWRHFL